MTSRLLLIVTGAIALIGGIIALFNPLAATITAERLAAWLFIFIAILQFIAIFQGEGLGSRVLSAILGVIFLMMGISLFNNPLAGILSLTILVGFLFLFGGISKIVFAFMGGIGQLWILAVSGAISLLLAFMIFSNFPASAATILGVLLAIELISTGVSLLAYGFGSREATA